MAPDTRKTTAVQFMLIMFGIFLCIIGFMAITEAQIVKKNTAVVHEFGVWNVVVPEHQKVMAQILFAGREVPHEYIDKI